MEAVGFVVDTATFERKSGGPVWGTIFFQFGRGCFPAPGWSDIVVPIIAAWLTMINRIAAGKSGTHEVYFMDGPYLIVARSVNETSVSLELVDDHPTKVTTPVSANLSMLLENAVAVGNQVEKECQARRWHDRDTTSLSNELRRATTAHPPLH
jgi:hypothetical protein